MVRNKKEDFIRFKYSTLCQLLPVTPYRYISSAKRQLNLGNDELKNSGFIAKYSWSEKGNKHWLIYYGQERAKKEIKRVKIKSINNRAKEYLPGPKEGEEIFSKEQVDLVNKIVKFNISKVTAQNLQTHTNTYFIRLLVGTPRTRLWCLLKYFKEVNL